MALVGEHDGDAGVEERELAQAMLERREIELHHREGLGRGQERHFGAALAVHVADDLERCDRIAVGELHEVFLAVAPDRELEPRRERVDDRDADAVQAAGDLVGILVEFPARVQLRHDHFGGRHPLLWMSTGMPRPSSITVQEPSGLSVTTTCVAWPASASSIALSTTS